MQIDNIDLGTLQQNKKHKFSALVRNDKNFPIKVTRIKVGCSSCTEATIKKYDIQPNEDVLMDISYKPFSVGSHDKAITVYYTENNVDLQYTFTFKAIVK